MCAWLNTQPHTSVPPDLTSFCSVAETTWTEMDNLSRCCKSCQTFFPHLLPHVDIFVCSRNQLKQFASVRLRGVENCLLLSSRTGISDWATAKTKHSLVLSSHCLALLVRVSQKLVVHADRRQSFGIVSQHFFCALSVRAVQGLISGAVRTRSVRNVNRLMILDIARIGYQLHVCVSSFQLCLQYFAVWPLSTSPVSFSSPCPFSCLIPSYCCYLLLRVARLHTHRHQTWLYSVTCSVFWHEHDRPRLGKPGDFVVQPNSQTQTLCQRSMGVHSPVAVCWMYDASSS